MDFIRDFLGSDQVTSLILALFTGAVTAAVGWLAYQFRRRILGSLNATELALLREIAAIAVSYAEQTGAAKASEEKLAEAVRVANTYLAAYGLNVRAEQLVAIIEAAVYAEVTKAVLPEPLPDA